MAAPMRDRLGSSFCAVALFLSTSSIVVAGDGKIDAPTTDILYSWTGFYAGAHFGALANRSEVSDPLGPSLFGNPNRAIGGFGGVDLGYNHQSGIVVYGFEADIAFPDIEGTGTCSSLSGSFINSNCKIGVDAFGTLTARLGLVLGPDGRSLIYGKAGAAWYRGNLDLATNDANTGDDGNPFTTDHNRLSHWGLALGAGVEYALTGNWSMKAEYKYANFGDPGSDAAAERCLERRWRCRGLRVGAAWPRLQRTPCVQGWPLLSFWRFASAERPRAAPDEGHGTDVQ